MGSDARTGAAKMTEIKNAASPSPALIFEESVMEKMKLKYTFNSIA